MGECAVCCKVLWVVGWTRKTLYKCSPFTIMAFLRNACRWKLIYSQLLLSFPHLMTFSYCLSGTPEITLHEQMFCLLWEHLCVWASLLDLSWKPDEQSLRLLIMFCHICCMIERTMLIYCKHISLPKAFTMSSSVISNWFLISELLDFYGRFPLVMLHLFILFLMRTCSHL